MTFPWILQRYIFREMGKVFLLTAVTMTGVIGLGGGLLKMIKLGEMSPGQLFRLMALVLPVAAALTLPIAALFSAAATYGRLSADNELTACRSGGINIHLLFIPTLVISLLSAAVTFGFINFLIPGMVRNLNEFIATDVGAMIQRRLNRPRGITLGGRFRIHADSSAIDASDASRAVLRKVAFVEVDQDEWVRFGTAREVDLKFEREDKRLRVAGRMRDLSFYDRKAARFFDVEEQDIPTNELPAVVPQEIKFLNLWEMLYHWRHPDAWRDVKDELARLRQAVARRFVYDELLERWQLSGGLVLEDERGRWTITSSAPPMRIPRDGGVELATARIEEHAHGLVRTITAGRAVLELAAASASDYGDIRIEVYDANLQAEGASVYRAKAVLGPVAVPAELMRKVEQMPEELLMSGRFTEGESDAIAERRARTAAVRGETVRRIVATLSERCAFSASVFVLVILGAALGIVFRGAHVVMAFGISFVPSLLVIVMIVMGKQMAHNAATHVPGLLVMWAGIGAVTGLDAWTLLRLVRR
ncbi:MAG: LptF/LptG family permease [Phycisphaerae bacterium]